MAKSLEYRITGDARDFNRTLKSVDKRLADSESRSKKFAGAVNAAIGVGAVGAFGALGKKAVDAAADIDESLSKNRVLFGRYAKDVEAFAATAASSLGMSRQSVLEYTGTFGNLFNALGVSNEESAKFSTNLTKLAADMASFNNTSPEEALEAIRSGLVGESEPLRRFGVNMNDATLRAEALRQGLIKTTKEALTPQEKALAAQAVIFRQTAAAHGDFERTSEGMANQQRILKAELSNLTAELGTQLLPVAKDVTSALVDFVQGMRDGEGAGGEFVATLKDIRDAVAPVVGFFKDHPALVAIAAGAWASYKVAATTATAIDNLSRIKKSFGRTVPVAASAGTAAGEALAGNVAADGASGINRASGRSGRLGRAFRTAGKRLGAAMAVALIAELALNSDDLERWVEKHTPDWLDPWKDGNPTDPGSSSPPGTPGRGRGRSGQADRAKIRRDAERNRVRGNSPNEGRPVGRAASVPRGGSGGGRVRRPGQSMARSQGSRTARASHGSDGRLIVRLGHWIQAQGFAVREQSHFDPVDPVHTGGSFHYKDRALDVSGASKERLDWLNGVLVQHGWFTIWQAPGHWTHIHVDDRQGGRVPSGGSGGGGSSSGGGGSVARPGRSRGSRPATTLQGRARSRPGGLGSTNNFGAILDANEALAGLTPGTADDLAALGAKRRVVARRLARARKRKDWAKVKEYAEELAGIDSSIAAATPEAAAGPSVHDVLDRDMALAQLTPGIDDDRAVLERRLAEYQGNLGHAQNLGDVAGQTAALQGIKATQDALEELKNAVVDNTQALLDIEKQRSADFQKALAVSQSQYGVLSQALFDAVNGGIGGMTRASFAGASLPAGSVARY